ncbi:MAG TPA: uroporphyrinogen-III C-methyltransferase [Bryobacteraceae bacterium]|nr:uroporphyrinogen-III C-methyltransferase [Bryobacteraceae bacterium]
MAEGLGRVSLVGAGPGDPDLITYKGRKLLASADAILYDHLAPESLLDLAPPHAERIYVGKKKSVHAFSQEEICAMMIDRARRGLSVVRLKGGDPFIFGRGGEEIEALAEAGIPYEVVPGVTSPLGIAAYTGVPLTHRDHTKLVTFVTGHDADGIDWSRVGQTETLVIFMGIHFIREITSELMKYGRSPDTPAMCVRWGTRPDQHTITGTLATIADQVQSDDIKPPATIIIGEVVQLQAKLNWFERLPLFGQRIVVTRARDQAPELTDKFRALGADVIEIPVIEIQPPADPGPLDRALAHLSDYDWIIFTSVNGVRHFLQRLDASPSDLRGLRARICAIGPATRRAIEALHLKVDLMPKEYVAESLVAALKPHHLAGKRILIPRAAVARDVIPVELTARGASVDVVEAYRNVVPANATARLAQLSTADWITFTSSSTVSNFVDLAAPPGTARIASIGPVTSETARSRGLHVDAEAQPYTIDGLVQAILNAGPAR